MKIPKKLATRMNSQTTSEVIMPKVVEKFANSKIGKFLLTPMIEHFRPGK